LEEEIAHLPPKIFKATTTLLNMRSSEQELCEFKRFEEAKVVKSRADRLDTEERGEFQRKMAASQTAQRELLAALHTSKQDEHQRHMKRNALHLKNHGEINMQQTRWRLQQNDQNMLHAHSLDSMAKPVFSYKALNQPRANYKNTASSNRGSQMLAKISKGRAAVSGLCAIHNFDEPPPEGTVIYTV
jgi:hypothetical protein